MRIDTGPWATGLTTIQTSHVHPFFQSMIMIIPHGARVALSPNLSPNPAGPLPGVTLTQTIASSPHQRLKVPFLVLEVTILRIHQAQVLDQPGHVFVRRLVLMGTSRIPRASRMHQHTHVGLGRRLPICLEATPSISAFLPPPPSALVSQQSTMVPLKHRDLHLHLRLRLGHVPVLGSKVTRLWRGGGNTACAFAQVVRMKKAARRVAQFSGGR